MALPIFILDRTYSAALQQQNINCQFGKMTLDYVTGEPDGFVSDITGTYNPTAGHYDLSWNTTKSDPSYPVTFDVAYSTSDMHVAGFSSGTSFGPVTQPDNSPYTEVNVSTPTVARLHDLRCDSPAYHGGCGDGTIYGDSASNWTGCWWCLWSCGTFSIHW